MLIGWRTLNVDHGCEDGETIPVDYKTLWAASCFCLFGVVIYFGEVRDA